MNSIEKVNELRDGFVNTAPPPDSTGQEMMLRTLLVGAAPHISKLVPDDPDDLDEMLERGVMMLLELRSDDRQPLALVHAQAPELAAGPEPEAA